MARMVSQTIKNLVAGISQQPASLRHPSQLEEQINGLSSETGGLQKRPPTLHIKRLPQLPKAGVKPLIHFINRDIYEKYIVIMDGTTIHIYDLQGQEIGVSYTSHDLEYLASDNPRQELRCVTVADYTFIVNVGKTVAMSTTADTNIFASQGALINVKSGQYGRTYQVIINGSVAGTYTTPDGSDKSHTTMIDTNYIASQLATSLNNNGYTTTQGESWVYINSNSISSLATKDGYNNQAMFGILKNVQKFSYLPASAPNGFTCRVQGEPGSSSDDYYVKFDASEKVWKECVCPGLCNNINADTMPHVLIRQANGNFEFKAASWEPRKTGDEDSNPEPSFIDQKINDIFFYRNRLGVVAGENVILSRSADFFNFWIASVTELQDTDAIDLAVSDNKIAILRHAIPFGDDCLLFSDNSQFALRASSTLTPKTATTPLLTNYSNTPEVKPVAAGRIVYFATKRAQYTSIKEYATATDNTEEKEAQETTAHAPNLIPNGLYKIISSNAENILLFLSTGAESKIFVYKYLYLQGIRQQASWSTWEFGAPIVGAEFINSDLYLVVQRDDYYYLEKMNFTYNTVDYAGEPYRIFVDRKVITEALPDASYNEADNLTTLNLSQYYNTLGLLPEREYAIVTQDGVFNRIEAGVSEVSLVGDFRGQRLIIGQLYNFRIIFSTLMIKRSNDNGSSYSETDGRLNIRYLRVRYSDSGYFCTTVEHKGKLTYKYPFTGRNLDSSAVIGMLVAQTGEFSVPIQSLNTNCIITIDSDVPTALALVGASWDGSYYRRTQSI